MARYTLYLLPESAVTVSNGVSLDGITQGDGSHLVGETVTLASGALDTLEVRDNGPDTNFDDNDGNQRLDGAQTLDGVTYSNGTEIEAEYQIDLRAPDGTIYTAVSVNLDNSSPQYGTVEGLAFVDAMPPRGVALEVIEAREGPGSFGQPSIAQDRFVPCFCAGTLIETPTGPRPIEDLRVGDPVITDTGRAAPLRWIGRRTVGTRDLSHTPALRPIRIVAGALGHGLPRRDLLVSRQHRMLVRSKVAQRMIGTSEVLIPAIKLTALPGIFEDQRVTDTVYLHLLLDRHELVLAEGAWSESLLTGPGALEALGQAARDEILTLFPEIAGAGYCARPARPIPSGRQQKQLVARHIKNNKPLVLLHEDGAAARPSA
jgi:hypothetical protein